MSATASIEPGYKVVRQTISCTGASMRGYKSVAAPGPAVVIYRIGEWAEPNPGCGPLAVFRTASDASGFWLSIYDREGLVVLPCEFEPVTRVVFPSPSNAPYVLWCAGSVYPQRGKGATELPLGTALASRVKLVGPDPTP